MRKLLLSALACAAFTGSAFASNEVVVEKPNSINSSSNAFDFDKVCKLRVTVKSDGVYYYYIVYVTIPDDKNCSDFTTPSKDKALVDN